MAGWRACGLFSSSSSRFETHRTITTSQVRSPRHTKAHSYPRHLQSRLQVHSRLLRRPHNRTFLPPLHKRLLTSSQEPISDFPYLPSTPYLPLLNSPFTSLRTLSTSIDATTDPRVSYPFWLLQGGLFLDVFTGQTGLSASLALLEPSQRAAALPDDARPLFPHLAVDESWPPTYFIHGTADTAVPVSESREMAKLLDSKGVPYDLVEVEGAGHAFDKVAESREIAGLEGAVPFLLKYAPQAKQ